MSTARYKVGWWMEGMKGRWTKKGLKEEKDRSKKLFVGGAKLR
jgi:hypothetical protein